MNTLPESAICRDRSAIVARLGDPSKWTGDWDDGRHVSRNAPHGLVKRLERFVVAQFVAGWSTQRIADTLCVTTESIKQVLRASGLGNPPGETGRPKNTPDVRLFGRSVKQDGGYTLLGPAING